MLELLISDLNESLSPAVTFKLACPFCSQAMRHKRGAEEWARGGQNHFECAPCWVSLTTKYEIEPVPTMWPRRRRSQS